MVALICDDNVIWRRSMVRGVLMGHAVHEADDIESGIETAERVQPNVIVVDSLLPDGIGWQAIPRFRRAAPLAKIVVMTAYPDRVDALRAIGYEYGAFAYIWKTEGRDQIREKLEKAFMASVVGIARRSWSAPSPPAKDAADAPADAALRLPLRA